MFPSGSGLGHIETHPEQVPFRRRDKLFRIFLWAFEKDDLQQLEQVFTCDLRAGRQKDRQKGEELKRTDINSTLPAVWRQLWDARPNASTLFPPPLVPQELREVCVRACVWLAWADCLRAGSSSGERSRRTEQWGKPGFELQLRQRREWESVAQRDRRKCVFLSDGRHRQPAAEFRPSQVTEVENWRQDPKKMSSLNV